MKACASGNHNLGLWAALSERIVALIGIPIVWHGTQFALVSRTGDYLSVHGDPRVFQHHIDYNVSRSLGLVHLDLKKDLSSTLS